MPNDLVIHKLEHHVVPYIVSGRRLRRQWFYMTNTLFGYTTDTLGAVATLGLTVPPLLSQLDAAGSSDTEQASIIQQINGLPEGLYYPVLLVAVLWVILRMVFARENGQKRAVLAKSAAGSMRQAEVMLHQHLTLPDPLPALNELLDKHLAPTVQRTMYEEAWPWVPFAPGIDEEVKKLTAQLVTRYGKDWTPPPPVAGPQQHQQP
jgi:hypothetical protein